MTPTSEVAEIQETVRRYPFGRVRHDRDLLHAQLRQKEPVCRIQLPYGPPARLVTNHRLAKTALADPRLSREATLGPDMPRYSPVEFGQVPESILSTDPSAHPRIRQLVGRAVTARRVEQLRSRVRRIASGLADDIQAAGAPADLVESLSSRLPVMAISKLRRIPWEDRHTLRVWGRAAAGLLPRRGRLSSRAASAAAAR